MLTFLSPKQEVLLVLTDEDLRSSFLPEEKEKLADELYNSYHVSSITIDVKEGTPNEEIDLTDLSSDVFSNITLHLKDKITE